MALTATKLPASPTPGVYNHGFLSAKVNEIIDEAVPAQTFRNDRTVTVEYNNTTLPTLPATISTAVNPTLFANDVDLTVAFTFAAGGINYVIEAQYTAVAFSQNPLSRVSRTAEAEGVGGDASLYAWYDDTAGDIKALLDFDGGGKTAVSLVVTAGFNTPVPV